MASLAEAIVRKNGFDGVVEVINSRVEDIDHLNELVVDVIVSEWMGEKEQEEEKDGPGPVMVSDTLCPAVHILGT